MRIALRTNLDSTAAADGIAAAHHVRGFAKSTTLLIVLLTVLSATVPQGPASMAQTICQDSDGRM